MFDDWSEGAHSLFAVEESIDDNPAFVRRALCPIGSFLEHERATRESSIADVHPLMRLGLASGLDAVSLSTNPAPELLQFSLIPYRVFR